MAVERTGGHGGNAAAESIPDPVAPVARRKVPLSDPERQREIFFAARAVLAEVGFERFNMDLVAARVRASKATLYQRWPSKAELIVDALHAEQPHIPEPDTGSLIEDLRAIGQAWAKEAQQTTEDVRGMVLGMLEGGRRDPELARLQQERASQARPDLMKLALTRAAERGEIPAAVDTDLLLQLPAAIYLFNLLFLDDRPDAELINRLIDGIIAPLLRDRGDFPAP